MILNRNVKNRLSVPKNSDRFAEPTKQKNFAYF